MQHWLQTHLASYDDLRAQCGVDARRSAPPRLRVVPATQAAGVR
jgi:hypothetical protein